MAGREIRYQTLILTMGVVAIVLVLTTILASGQSSEVKLFIVAMTTLLVAMNLVGFFIIWGASGTVVDEVFVMTPSGMLLKHYTRRLRPDQDEDILAGMLTAVQNFIKESFDEGSGRLSEIRFENYDIMISYSESLVLAAVISTKKPEKLREKLNHAARQIEQAYGDRLKSWSGDVSELKHIDAVIKSLLGRL